jgi:error-prone DNA polymerase
MHRLFAECPQAIQRGLDIVRQCNFTMDELKYEYPDELVPPGQTPIEYLKHLTWTGAAERYPGGLLDRVRQQLENELKLIEQLKIEAYFLTVYDLVKYARSRGILCQGRGSAANSAVCYCIGVTSVDPAKIDLLFERFVSAARNEPPDIDIDFEHERREEVIQYVYQKYGRDRCGIAAEVITYRGRSAVRDVGKAMGLSLDMVDSMARKLDWWHRGTLQDAMIREAGLDPTDRTVKQVVDLVGELLGFPRHLSQHVGGMVMTRVPLCELVPIENAAMEDRTVIEWDKDDIDELGILKVDVLALGMLTCISKAFGMLNGSDEATERRSDEGEEETERADHGNGENISRLDRVAARDGVGENGLHGNGIHASFGAVRVDRSNAPSSRLDPLEHCRRPCPAEPPGLPETPSDRSRITGGIINTIRTGHELEAAPQSSETQQPSRRRGPYLAGSHSELGAQNCNRDLNPSPFPPLRRFVASSLRRSRLELHTVPAEDPAVYDMICDADTIGVFQIESRAQMSMLPRLRPRNFYDLVIEVAIVRPGPIQGNMVHPYLRRRNGEEKVTYPSEELRQVLQKTLGVPLFQEQAMKIAMVGAGFSGAEADRLRRAMAAWRKSGELLKFHDKIVQGMLKNGYTLEFAEQCFEQIKGFGEYGFPESHSASFALLVYVSCWLKRHHPAAFCAALINSQPMGFYQPAQIVRDAREHGVEVRGVDVNESEWDCMLERRSDEATERRRDDQVLRADWGIGGPAVRLGFRLIKGLRQAHAQMLVAARHRHGKFDSVEHFQQCTNLPVAVVRRLAEADGFASLALSRRQSLWDALELKDHPAPFFSAPSSLRRSVAPSPFLPPMPLPQEVRIDYETTSLSLKKHPVSFARQTLSAQRILSAKEANVLPHGRWVKVAGLVLIRQRPGTASGIVFITLEDETGIVNLIVRPDIYDKYRSAARHAALLQCDGYLERQGQVVHVMAKRLIDRSELIRGYEISSRDFH